MKISLICVGKTTYAPFREAIERYASRIPHYLPFEIKEIPDIKNTRSLSAMRQKGLEGEAIIAALSNSDHVVLLDERGREFSSREFAGFVSSKMIGSVQRLVFVIGGPYGFSDRVYGRADSKLSLSKMTLPHELVRVFFLEQLYRALTIIQGEPYHHD